VPSTLSGLLQAHKLLVGEYVHTLYVPGFVRQVQDFSPGRQLAMDDRTVGSVVNAGAGRESQEMIVDQDGWKVLRHSKRAAHPVSGQETLLDELRGSVESPDRAAECQENE
jgi:hypothetical protein